MSFADLRVITLDLLHGLVTMHNDGVAHMDFKEKNMLVQVENGRVVAAALCDFEWVDTAGHLGNVTMMMIDILPKLFRKAKKEPPDFVRGFRRSKDPVDGEEILFSLSIDTAIKLLAHAETYFSHPG